MRVTKEMIDPELRFVGQVMRVLFGGNKSVADLRKPDGLGVKLVALLPHGGLDVETRAIPRADGSRLNVLIATRSRGTAKAGRPGILWLHGGAYAVGSARGELTSAKRLLDVVDGVVVSPDYRLSKHAPYPAALDDCYLTLQWLKENAEALGVRSDQLIVAGGSAGGGLTAAVSLAARERGDVRIAFQMPIYPMIDDRGTPSSIDNDAPVCDGPSMEAAWRVYLGDLYGGDVPATAAPARATDYRNLPPTITFVGGVDPFRDETLAYAENLRRAGVPVEVREFKGAWHGFDGIAPWTKIAKEANRWWMDNFRAALAQHFARQDPTPGAVQRTNSPERRTDWTPVLQYQRRR
jgi:acetyl esterase/lipase